MLVVHALVPCGSVDLASTATVDTRRFATDRDLWEKAYRRTFPGRDAGGVELNCASTPEITAHDESRQTWARKSLRTIKSSELAGLEIGACNFPVKMPHGVRMTYLDANDDPGNMHCFAGNNVRPSIIDDAQALSRVPESKFDFILANHVLEHMTDFLGAVEAWVRSVRPGGMVMFALPDPCDNAYPNGERYRLAANASHYVKEYRAAKHAGKRERALQSSGVEHFLDAAVALAFLPKHATAAYAKTFNGTKGKLFAQTAATRLSDSKCSADYVERCLASMDEPPSLHAPRAMLHASPGVLECLACGFKVDPGRAHYHVWSADTLLETLTRARTLFPRRLRFKISKFYVATRQQFSMREYRVVLTRNTNEKRDDKAARRIRAKAAWPIARFFHRLFGRL
jgi:hypothetical protein